MVKARTPIRALFFQAAPGISELARFAFFILLVHVVFTLGLAPFNIFSMSSHPIGVFDSGLGGLTVLKTLAERFPSENFLYLGDTARLPYGTKSPATIRRYSEQIMDFLLTHEVKAMVVACNSASSTLRETHWKDIPVYDVITPGAKRAVEVSSSKRIGVLGTRATVNSRAYLEKIRALSSDAQVFSQACPLFVSLVEEGWLDDPITNLVTYRYLQPLVQQQVDTLVLGCTHYPLLTPSLRKVLGNSVALVDSGSAIADQMADDFASGTLPRSTGNELRQLHRQLQIGLTDFSAHTENLAYTFMSPLEPTSIEAMDL